MHEMIFVDTLKVNYQETKATNYSELAFYIADVDEKWRNH